MDYDGGSDGWEKWIQQINDLINTPPNVEHFTPSTAILEQKVKALEDKVNRLNARPSLASARRSPSSSLSTTTRATARPSPSPNTWLRTRCDQTVDPLMFEEYSASDLDSIVTIITDLSRKKGQCLKRSFIKDAITVTSEVAGMIVPNNVFADWVPMKLSVPIDAAGFGGKPGQRLFVRISGFSTVFVTWKSLLLLLTVPLRKWFAYPVLKNVKIGNLAGVIGQSMMHGQQSETVYKLYPQKLANGNQPMEERDEYTIVENLPQGMIVPHPNASQGSDAVLYSNEVMQLIIRSIQSMDVVRQTS